MTVLYICPSSSIQIQLFTIYTMIVPPGVSYRSPCLYCCDPCLFVCLCLCLFKEIPSPVVLEVELPPDVGVSLVFSIVFVFVFSFPNKSSCPQNYSHLVFSRSSFLLMLAAALFDSSFFNSCKSTSGTETCKILQYIKINNICSKRMFLLRNIFKRHEISLFQQGLFCGKP